MPSSQNEVRTITRDELPQLIAEWQRETCSGLALFGRTALTANWYLAMGGAIEDTYVYVGEISWDDLKPIVACANLRRLALPGLELGDAGARAIAENLTNLHWLYLGGHGVGEAGARAIAENLASLQSLYLGFNSVGDAGARAIAENLTNLQTLDLFHNRIGEAGARAIAENLTNLHTLNLSSNTVGDAGARAIAENLTNLHTLNLISNTVGDAGALAIAGNLTNLHTLDLGGNSVGDAGARAIAENLTNLQSLHLYGNNVGDAGAVAIAEKLGNLRSLNLGRNNVGDAGAVSIAEKLGNLRSLNLGRNKVGDAGARAIAENLTNLQSLVLSYNKSLTVDAVRRLVEGLPRLQALALDEINELGLPEELMRATNNVAALRDYFRRTQNEGKRKLNEAKLIVVGNEAVGKTALVNYLIHNQPCRDTDKTQGLYIQERIEVTPWDTHRTAPDAEPLRLNVWDFGGQEVTRETHKLFLTARSLYLVVLEARRENAADAENVLHDWMRAIRNRGGDDVPIIVVINKSEGDRELRLDETTLMKTYPIRGFIRTSCCDPSMHPDGGKGIVELRQTIVDTIRREIPQASDEFPVSYFEVKERLRNVAKAEHSFDIIRFTNICRDVENPVTSDEEQRLLLQLLADIGVVIQHKQTTLLDPNWLTTAIYRVLTHSDVVKQAGLFRVDDLGRLLKDLEDADRKYPQDRWQYIVDQTVECGLSFEIADQPGTYLMPEQLSPNAIDTGLDSVDDPQVLRFRYDYEDIPKGLMPRFIVKMHHYLSKQRTCWANGVVLYVGTCKILVRSDRRTRSISIFVHGPANERRESMRIVREGLEWVHSLFEEIGPKPMVPVKIPNKPDAAIAYSQLIEFERAGFEKFPLEGAIHNICELLSGIAPVELIRVADDRRPDLYIHAGEWANVQVISGNNNDTIGSRNRTAPANLLSSTSGPKPIWQPLVAPIAVTVATAILLLMWITGVELKWISLFGLPILAGGVAHMVNLYYDRLARTWARQLAAWCLTISGACLMAPGVKLLVHLNPESKWEFVMDNAPWFSLLLVPAACFFGWLQYKMEQNQQD